MTKLGGRIDSSGVLHLSGDRYRSQHRNRADVMERLGAMLAGALKRERTRVGTTPTRASQDKRIRAKKRRSEIKRGRKITPEDY